MPHNLLNKCCVRTFLFINDEKVNQGTGVIIHHGGKYYVLTAEHCVNGDKGQFSGINPQNIIIEFQSSYDATFSLIQVIAITEINEKYDWALLEIEDPKIDCDFMDINIGDRFLKDEPVHFRGYQAVNNTTPRTWPAKILDLTEGEFKITLVDKSFEQGGELGAKLAKGLSGSGVFVIRANRLYLVGHLKSVIGKKALNDDIHCCPINGIAFALNKDVIDLSDIELIDLWEQAMEKKATEDDVKYWIDQNDEHFDNLLRKSKMLSSNEEKAEENARKRILRFLDQEYKNYNISGVSGLITAFEKTSETFEESVKEAYTRSVNNSSEAKDLLIKLEKDFMDHIRELINDKSNKNTLELAKHKVTWWLMNCSFDFRE